MKDYILSRVLLACITILFVTTLVFFLIHLLPGDPIDMLLGENAFSADREALRQQLGLNLSVGLQYLHFLAGLAQGHVGRSIFTGEGVAGLVASRYPATLALAMLAMFFAVIISIPVGILAASRVGRVVDGMAMFGAVLGMAVPTFLSGPLLILLFAVWLGWLPVSGREEWGSVILPALTLGLPMAAILTRLTRKSMLNILSEDFVRAAAAKGVSRWKVLCWHALMPAANPIISVAGLQLGALLTGAIVTEKIFSWPGVGSLLVKGLLSRDYPVVQGCLLAIGFTYVAVNLITDLLYAKLDPRVRLGTK